MGGLVIETIRPGVQFTPDAAAGFRRAEAQVRGEFGRDIDVNSTYRSWAKQMAMYLAWMVYVASGYLWSKYPGHSKAVHPSQSFHVAGIALDSDDWRIPRIVQILADNGFIRNRLDVPNERHHFEYIRAQDKNYGKPAAGPASAGGGTSTPAPQSEEEDEDMKPFLIWKKNPNGTRQWALISGDLSRMVPIFKLATANALGKLYGAATEVVQNEWDGFVNASEIEVVLTNATEPADG